MQQAITEARNATPKLYNISRPHLDVSYQMQKNNSNDDGWGEEKGNWQ